MDLETSMQEAWLQRASAAKRDIIAARTAPALFKPEFVEQRERDYARAMGFAGVWA